MFNATDIKTLYENVKYFCFVSCKDSELWPRHTQMFSEVGDNLLCKVKTLSDKHLSGASGR